MSSYTINNTNENLIEYTYRGSIKSCNYKCSYCPFSKNKLTLNEINNDKIELSNFFSKLDEISKKKNIFITPYGEALIHKYYRDEIEKNIVKDSVENIGIQTNLSLDIIKWVSHMKEKKLPIHKINLWITCHFQEISYGEFMAKIRGIYQDVNISVGVVGIPSNSEKILKLRQDLPKNIYLWINEYSKLKGNYSEELIKMFQKIDPIFFRRNEIDFSERCSCGVTNFFIEGNGRVKRCNLNPSVIGNIYIENTIKQNTIKQNTIKQNTIKQNTAKQKECLIKNCDCYLSFSKFNSSIFNFFGSKKLYRIPEKISINSIFFDIDGTLVENGKIRHSIIETIEYLYNNGYNLYFITDIPMENALRKCNSIKKYFKGGIFHCGAHIFMKSSGTFEEISVKENMMINSEIDFEIFETFQENLNSIEKFVKKAYLYNDLPYKVLLTSSSFINNSDSNKYETIIANTTIFKGIPTIMVKKGTNKYSALEKIIDVFNLNSDKILVVGNDINDIVLFENIKHSICVLNGNNLAKSKSRYIMDIEHIPYILN